MRATRAISAASVSTRASERPLPFVLYHNPDVHTFVLYDVRRVPKNTVLKNLFRIFAIGPQIQFRRPVESNHVCLEFTNGCAEDFHVEKISSGTSFDRTNNCSTIGSIASMSLSFHAGVILRYARSRSSTGIRSNRASHWSNALVPRIDS